MKDHSRTLKILVSLVASMTVGGGVLMLLDRQGPSQGAFSLASYTRLDSVENALAHNGQTYAWDRIEVFYSQTPAGTLDTYAQWKQLSSTDELNFHFMIYNGLESTDGLIVSTNRWLKQRPCLPNKEWYGTSQTIRICVIGDGVKNLATDSQIRRTWNLIDKLKRRMNITSDNIVFPANWQL